MAKRVMLAAAGAGKTYTICREIRINEKNLILAFTHENIKNIHRELIVAHGKIPELTTVMTFDSFVYRLLVSPYEPSILRHYDTENTRTKGITLRQPPSIRVKNNKGELVYNHLYVKDNTFAHYITKSGQYYNAYTTKLIMSVKENNQSLINRVAKTLNLFFDHILIDEFQDFRLHDYDVILGLVKNIDNILLVGDYYQHSVSAINNTGRPFVLGRGKSKREVTYEQFVEELKRKNIDVDDTTLQNSRRCPQDICDFVREKLKINIAADNDNQGKVHWIADTDADTILSNDKIVKLVWENASTYTFPSQNWSYSKGNTLNSVCVILTDKLSSLSDVSFDVTKVAKSTLNKLYVALTRTKGDLYILKHSAFKNVESKYKKTDT